MSSWYDSSLIDAGVTISSLNLARYNRRLLRGLSPIPVDVSLKVTEKCNSRCITCNVWKEQDGKPDLTVADFDDIFSQFKSVKIRNIGFYGGEALLRKDIGELIQRAKRIVPGVRVQVTTNGLLLKSKAAELVEGGIDMVSISLDGIGEVNDKIRGVPGYYQRVVEGIEEVKRYDKKGRILINTGATLVSQNIHQVPEMIDLANGLGISWSFNLFDTSPYHFTNIDDSLALKQIDGDVIDETIRYMYEARKKYPKTMAAVDPVGLEFAREYLRGRHPYFHCVLGYFRIYMDSYLNVYSGCWALPPVGNLREQSLQSILNSSQYKERLNDMYELKCPYCTCGFLINLLISYPYSGIKYLLRNMSHIKRDY